MIYCETCGKEMIEGFFKPRICPDREESETTRTTPGPHFCGVEEDE